MERATEYAARSSAIEGVSLMHNLTAVITLLDERPEWAERFKAQTGIELIEYHTSVIRTLIDLLGEKGFEVLNYGEVLGQEGAIAKFDESKNQDVISLIIHVPGWAEPNIAQSLALLATKRDFPVLLWGSTALSGVMAAKGALEAVGVNFTTVFGIPEEKEAVEKITSFLKAAGAYKAMQNKKLGLFGGISMGIYNWTGCLSEYKKFFGIDTIHFDEEQILKEKTNDKLVEKYFQFLKRNLKEIKFDGDILTPEKLRLQIKAYLGMKEISRRNNLQLLTIKCIPYFCDTYATLCLIPTFFNDTFDAEGKKGIIPCTCEGDTNTAICVEILKNLSGRPVFYGDLITRIPETNSAVCCACGGAPPYFSRRSEDYKENLRAISLYPQVQGKAGGGALSFMAEKEEVVTVCSFIKRGESFEILTAIASIEPDEVLDSLLPKWAKVFLKFEDALDNFLAKSSTQHVCISIGDHSDEIRNFCKIAGIQYRP